MLLHLLLFSLLSQCAVFPFVGVSVFASDANVTLLVATRFCFTAWLLATCFLHSAHSVVEFTLWESGDIDCSAFTYMVLSKQLMLSLGMCSFSLCRVTAQGLGFTLKQVCIDHPWPQWIPYTPYSQKCLQKILYIRKLDFFLGDWKWYINFQVTEHVFKSTNVIKVLTFKWWD